MRKGLLLTGGAIAVIGVGVLVASLSLMSGVAVTQTSDAAVPNVPPHSSYTLLVSGVNQSSATTNLVWASSQYLQVALYAPGPCAAGAGICPNGPPIATWWNDSGTWSESGRASFPLILNLTNPNASRASFTATVVETYTPGASSTLPWLQYLPLIGAGVLVAIGGLAVFLGLFLRSGVYGRGGATVPPGDLDEDFDDPYPDSDIDGPPDREEPPGGEEPPDEDPP
ncbi:MAG: hypothetical protein WBF81_09795 [Thermoplasmata archaeon]